MGIRVKPAELPVCQLQTSSSQAQRSLQGADALGDWDASQLARMVAEAHGVTPEELFHHSRSRAPIATTRQIAMYLMHVLLGRSLTDVGEFYKRDRTTVSYACARIEDMREDAAFDVELTQMEDHIWTEIGRRHAATPIAGPIDVAESANDI